MERKFMNKGPKCPELVAGPEWMVLLCEKGSNAYGQGISELNQFCKSEDYPSCPFFKGSRKLSFDVNSGHHDRGVRTNGM
jgi:hypothetical protein